MPILKGGRMEGKDGRPPSTPFQSSSSPIPQETKRFCVSPELAKEPLVGPRK